MRLILRVFDELKMGLMDLNDLSFDFKGESLKMTNLGFSRKFFNFNRKEISYISH